MLMTVAQQFSKGDPLKYKLYAVGLTIFGFFGGLFPFGTIINLMCPVVGYIGLILILGMVYRNFINKGKLQ